MDGGLLGGSGCFRGKHGAFRLRVFGTFLSSMLFRQKTT